jgi:hypothetical protein
MWAAIVATALGVMLVGATASAAQSPKQLLTALLSADYPDRQLPPGFSGAKVSYEKPSGKFKGQVGTALVEVTGPDVVNFVRYGVYTSSVLARKALHDPKAWKDNRGTLLGPAPGWGRDSVMVVGSVTGKNMLGKEVTNGYTVLAVLRGGVIVQAYSVSVDNKDSGNITSARKLLRSAVQHLDRVKKRRG